MKPEEVFQRFERDPGVFTRIPTSTYRLQLGPNQTFANARELVPYLASLGITDCHFSPYLQPCGEQSHGYDVADHGQLNAALGSEADYYTLVEALRRHGMGQIMDVVPNHMGIAGSRNAWWTDVLENGQASPSASFFDIEWDPIKPELKNKVLLPILGDQYGRALEQQELQLEFKDGAFSIRYYDTVLPVTPRTYVAILEWHIEDLQQTLGAEHPQFVELRSIITGLGHLPSRTEQDPVRIEERHREKEVLKRRLATLVGESPAVHEFVEANVLRYNGVKGDPRSFDRLDELLAAQTYRLSFWQVAGDEINYRRFFDINELAAIRMEEPAVFEAAHRLVFRFVREGAVTGLRIDHPDGLFAPARYLRDLERRCFLERARSLRGVEGVPASEQADWERVVLAEFDRRVAEEEEAARQSGGREGGWPGRDLRRRWSAARRAARGGLLGTVQAMFRRPVPAGSLARSFYIVTEKILMAEEQLPGTWPVAGTTGYEFLNVVNGLFVDSSSVRRLDDTYARFIGGRIDFPEVAYQSKRLVMETSMASEITMLGHRLGRISERRRSARDFTDRMLTAALREIIACFPVYRTYIATEDPESISERDRRYVETAVAEARRRNPTVSASVFEFIRGLLCLEHPPDMTDGERAEALAFVGTFQQLTGPFTAKGIEDTAFYRYHRLISLNEVGGDPEAFGTSPDEFHQRCLERLAHWPSGMSVLSTHDTKRGEDMRARINVISEIPQKWRERVRVWHRLNRGKKMLVEGDHAPDKNDEYLLYQTLIGAWPASPAPAEHEAFVERIQRFMHKALREAKTHVSWINPRPEYDQAVHSFVAALLDQSGPNAFLEDFLPFQARVAELGMYNSLAQTVLRLAAPGVAELYQGAELWELNLVDPDNRRPVDFSRRQAMLVELQRQIAEANGDLKALAQTLLDERLDGRIKLYIVHRGLTYRREHAQLFLRGDYAPLEVSGSRWNHVCSFSRAHEAEEIIVAVPRLLARLSEDTVPVGRGVWGEDSVVLRGNGNGRAYRDLFTGEVITAEEHDGRRTLPLAAVFSALPVAILERTKGA